MSKQILKVQIATENDLVVARQRARQIASLLGFESQDQTRIATAVSEIARNAFRYAGRGNIEFALEGQIAPQVFLIRISDSGAGIANLKEVLDGSYNSRTGMGLGLVGARRLMDQLDIETSIGKGTTVTLHKSLPRRAPVAAMAQLSQIAKTLAQSKLQNPAEEVLEQNRELLSALEELRRRQDELTQLNHELEDTNRGVVALYAELADKADHLRQADEMKSKFLSNMSHEFRTPLNSILALSRLLLDRADGELTGEQEKQAHFIYRSAEALTELVNDLLDLAKVESGKVAVTATRFTVENLFGALRGMLRPLLVGRSVNLVYEEAAELPEFVTDEGKVSQIMRNLISNALKFTERGEVRVSARQCEGDVIELAVADTGIGIAPEHLGMIFQEFAQVDNAFQRHVKGTGLGLPLSRKLSELLGGTLSLQSEVGIGSTFTVSLPRVHQNKEEETAASEPIDESRVSVVIVSESDETVQICEAYLRDTPYQGIPSRSMAQARAAMKDRHPGVMILDVPSWGNECWKLLPEARNRANAVPVIVAGRPEDRAMALSLGAESFTQKPLSRDWLLPQLANLTGTRKRKTALLIDDEDIARYLVRQSLMGLGLNFIEANSGEKGLEMALEKQPHVIFLDLSLPGLSGQQVLESLKGDARTSSIPVVIVTSQVLKPEELNRLNAKALSVVSKETLGGREASEKFQSLLAVSEHS